MLRLIKIIPVLVLFAVAPVTNAMDKNTELESIEIYSAWSKLVKDSYKIVHGTRDISKDPELAVILQLQKIGDIYREKGDSQKLIETLEYVLKKSNNRAVRNAAYHLLSDRLRDLGEHEKALEMLKKGLEENLQNTK